MQHAFASTERPRRSRSTPLRLAAVAAFALAALAPAARASDQMFTHTYLSETSPKGSKEIEQWVTFRDKKSQGTYRLWQTRTEFEYAVTDDWQLSLYGNAYSVTAEDNNSNKSRRNFTVGPGDGDEVTGGGPATIGSYVPFAERLPVPAARYHETAYDSASLESIYQILSPYKDSIGLSGYVEATAGPKTRELELKLLVQKNLMEDDLVLAGNLALEFERDEYSRVVTEHETEMILSVGASYRVRDGLRLALEMRNERSWEGVGGYSLRDNRREYSAWFAGPTVQYAGRVGEQGFYVTAGYSQQLPWASAYSNAAKVEKVNGRVYKDTEKHVVRMIVGVNF